MDVNYSDDDITYIDLYTFLEFFYLILHSLCRMKKKHNANIIYMDNLMSITQVSKRTDTRTKVSDELATIM
jgi:hypothetical protein